MKKRNRAKKTQSNTTNTAVLSGFLTEKLFKKIAREYRRETGAAVYAVDQNGVIIFGRVPCPKQLDTECCQARMKAGQETLRWGEPSVCFCSQKRLLWAVPVMINQKHLGSIVASLYEKDVFSGSLKHPPINIRSACIRLRELCEKENVTNAAALDLKRLQYHEEQQRAYAIHSFKQNISSGIRELYLREEPALFSSIRSGDRSAAREIINKILVAIHHHAGDRIDLVKSFFLELVASMCRTAVEAGGDPEELLGANFISMAKLSRVSDEASLARWVSRTLEHLLDRIHAGREKNTDARLFDALAFMERHFTEKISRDDAARAAHISPSHFSYLLKKETGATFTDLLNRMRADYAAEKLARTSQPLGLIAIEAGFSDQSYFTKIFRKFKDSAPLEYRRNNQKSKHG